MKNKSTRNKNLTRVNEDFRLRLKTYYTTLENIRQDYQRGLVLAPMPKEALREGESPDLFSWVRGEAGARYKKNLERRLKNIKRLQEELRHVLEVSSWEDCPKCAANEPGLGEVLGL